MYVYMICTYTQFVSRTLSRECIYTHIYVYIYVYVYVCIYIYSHVYICVCARDREPISWVKTTSLRPATNLWCTHAFFATQIYNTNLCAESDVAEDTHKKLVPLDNLPGHLPWEAVSALLFSISFFFPNVFTLGRGQWVLFFYLHLSMCICLCASIFLIYVLYIYAYMYIYIYIYIYIY